MSSFIAINTQPVEQPEIPARGIFPAVAVAELADRTGQTDKASFGLQRERLRAAYAEVHKLVNGDFAEADHLTDDQQEDFVGAVCALARADLCLLEHDPSATKGARDAAEDLRKAGDGWRRMANEAIARLCGREAWTVAVI